MRVFTFECTDADVPAGHRFMARIRCELTGKGNKPVSDWHPVVCRGATAEAAEAQATDFWNAEVAAAQAKKASAEKRAAARKAALPTKDGEAS